MDNSVIVFRLYLEKTNIIALNIFKRLGERRVWEKFGYEYTIKDY